MAISHVSGALDPEAHRGGRLHSLLKNARIGLFGTLFVIQKKAHASTVRSILGSVIRIFQMLSFLISPYAFKNWNEQTLSVVRFILGLPTVHGYWSFFTVDAYLAMYYASLVWVAVFIGLTAWASYGFVKNSFRALWPLQLLRSIGTLSGSILFIPLFTLLLSNYQCGLPHLNKMLNKSGLFACYSGGHLAQSVLTGVLTIAFVALCSIFALVFYDSSPVSNNIVAKAHGRVDFIFLILKIVLVITVETFPTELPTWLLVALLVLAGALWTLAVLYFLPFYDARWNAWTAAQASMFLYGSLCLVLSEWYPEHDAAVTMFLGIGLAGAVGAYVCHARQEYILRTPAVRLSSPYEIEIKARLMLHNALYGHPSAKANGGHGHVGAASADGGEGAHAIDGGALDDAEGNDDVEQRLLAARRLIPVHVLAEVQGLYRQSMTRFRGSSILHVFFSRFYSLTGNRHMQMSHLLQAERRHPPLDVAFLVFQARKLADDDSGSGGHGDAMARVTFEKHSADARKLVQRAAARQSMFWYEILDAQPDLSRLHMLSTEMGLAIEQAEVAFTALLQLNPQSVSTLRLYAAFNDYVLANPDKAGVFFQEADRIEEQKSKDHGDAGTAGSLVIMSESNLDVMADNTAVVTIAGTRRNLGVIKEANGATTKLFGYSKLQLERRYIFTLLPEPLAGLWESMLRTYVETGEGRITSTHVVFGLTRSSYIVPMLMCMRETPADEGPPAFIVLMRELSRAQDNYILLTSEGVITAASAGALQDLSIDPHTLAGHEVYITDFVLEWEAPNVRTELRTSRGSTLCIDAAAAHKAMGTKLGGVDDLLTPVMSFDSEGEDQLMTGRSVDQVPSGRTMGPGGSFHEMGAGRPGRVFVKAYMHAVSLKPPRDDRLAEDSGPVPPSPIGTSTMAPTAGVRTTKFADPSGNSVNGKRQGYSGRPGMATDRRDRDLNDRKSEAGGDVASVAILEPGAAASDTFFVLTYSRVSQSDTFTLAKAGKKRRDSLMAMAAMNGTVAGMRMRVPGGATSRSEGGSEFNVANRGALGQVAGTTAVMPIAMAASSIVSASDPHMSVEGQASPVSHPHAVPVDGPSVPYGPAGGRAGQAVHGAGTGLQDAGTDDDDGRDGAGSVDSMAPAHGDEENRKVLVRSTSILQPRPVPVPAAAGPSVVDAATSPVAALAAGPGATMGAPSLTISPRHAKVVSSPTRAGSSLRPGVYGPGGGPGSSVMKSNLRTVRTSGSVMSPGTTPGTRRSLRHAGSATNGSQMHLVHGDDSEDDDDFDHRTHARGGRASQDGRTVIDKQSDSSAGTYGRRVMNRLRRHLADQHASLSKGLMALRAAGIFVMVLSVALAVAAAVVLDTQFAGYRTNLVYTDMGSDRIVSMFTAIIHVEQLVFRARGWMANDAASITAERNAIRDAATTFVSRHRTMYKDIQGTSMAATYTDMVNYPVTLTEYDTPAAAGTDVGSHRVVNLFQAGLAMANALELVADAPLANLTDDTYAPTMFVLTNGLPGGVSHESIHKSSLETGYEMSLEAKDSVRMTALYVYAVISAVLAGVGLIVFTPILLNIEASKDAIVKRFVALPLLVKVALHRQSEKRGQELRRNFSDNDEDDEDEEDGFEDNLNMNNEGPGDESGRALLHGPNALPTTTQDGAAVDPSGGDDGEVDWDEIMKLVRQKEKASASSSGRHGDGSRGKSSSSSSSSGTKGGPGATAKGSTANTGIVARVKAWFEPASAKSYKKSSRSVLLLFGKFLGPLLALFLFFTAVYIVSTTMLEQTMRLSSATVAAAYRTACTRETLMDLNRAIMSHNDRAFFLIQRDAVADTIDCVRYHQQLLLFGVNNEESRGDYALQTLVMETGKHSLLSDETNDRIYRTQFSNACDELLKVSGGATSAADCAAFDGAIMQQGLSTAVSEYIRRATSVLDRRQRARVKEDTLEGWVVPVRSYPYANDTCAGGCWNYDAVSGVMISPAPVLSVHGDVPASWNSVFYNADPWRMADDITSADMEWLREADRLYITPLFMDIKDMYNVAGIATVDRYRSFLGVFVGVFVAAFVLFMMAGFLPAVRSLHNELQKKRSMLLFLPPQVIKGVPAIKALVDEILADDQMGLRSAGAAASVAMKAKAALREAYATGQATNGAAGADAATAQAKGQANTAAAQATASQQGSLVGMGPGVGGAGAAAAAGAAVAITVAPAS